MTNEMLIEEVEAKKKSSNIFLSRIGINATSESSDSDDAPAAQYHEFLAAEAAANKEQNAAKPKISQEQFIARSRL